MKNKIKKFIRENQIQTAGAITIPVVTFKFYDDGDTGFNIKVPYCPYNSTWQNSAFLFVKKFQEAFGHCPVHLNEKFFTIDYCLTYCDPD